MSSHTAVRSTEGTGGGRQLNFETSMRIATVIAAANERLFRIQSEAANAAFEANSKHLKTLLNTLQAKDPPALLAEWTNLYQANMRRALDVTRSCFEIVPQTQAEIANLMGEPFASANKETQQYLDQMTKAITDGRDAATATVEAFFKKANVSAVGTASTKKAKVA
jgi:phasin family protein